MHFDVPDALGRGAQEGVEEALIKKQTPSLVHPEGADPSEERDDVANSDMSSPLLGTSQGFDL